VAVGAGHTFSRLLVHVVFGTKDRRARIKAAFRERLYRYMAGIAKNEFGRVIEVGGTGDHVHVLLSLRATVSVAEAVRKLKSLSSGWVHSAFPDEAAFGWQTGYAAFTVSESNAESVAKYIRNQDKHHARQAFSEEFAALLRKHGIDPESGRKMA
jgi:putative transposase